MQYISTQLDYSMEDARTWLGTVQFARGTQGVAPNVVEHTVAVLRQAGVLVDAKDREEISRMIAFQKDSGAMQMR